jgi:heptosyltransferase-2
MDPGVANGGGGAGPRRVLVVRRRALGDLVLSLPALALLRRRLPGARLDLLMDSSLLDVARAWAGVDRVLAFPDRGATDGAARLAALWRLARELARQRYDLVVDLHSTPQTALLCRLTGAPRRIGLDLRGRRWAYTVRVRRGGGEPGPDGRPRYIAAALVDLVHAALGESAEGESVEPRLPPVAGAADSARPPAGSASGPRIAIAPGATWGAKAWPAASYREVARRLVAERGARVTVFWGPGEQPLARAVAEDLPGVEVAPPGDVLQLADRLCGFDLLLSGDSGTRHIAIAAGLRTLALFGPTDPWTATPSGARQRWLRYPIACAPCQRTACELATNHCLARIAPETVLRAVGEMLG